MDNELVYSYTRADALADGVLVDASELAREIGFTIPVAVTSACWQKYVAVPAELEGLQDEEGRLWDILCMLRTIANQQAEKQEPLCSLAFVCQFPLYVQNAVEGDSELVKLKAIWHPGDDWGKVVTVMLPWED